MCAPVAHALLVGLGADEGSSGRVATRPARRRPRTLAGFCCVDERGSVCDPRAPVRLRMDTRNELSQRNRIEGRWLGYFPWKRHLHRGARVIGGHVHA
jgi:hypothetical protein